MALSEIEQINAIVGLSRRIAGWPSTLADLGYTLDRLELRVEFRDPDDPHKNIVSNPDLFFLADKRNLSLLLELKSGTFQGFDQMDRMVKVSPEVLVRRGRTVIRNLTTHSISFAQLINQEVLAQYLPEFKRTAHKASLLSISTTEIRAHYGELADSKAQDKFSRGVPIDFSRRPTRLIRVLPNSDHVTLTLAMVDAFKKIWLDCERVVTPDSLARGLFTEKIWNLYDDWAQKVFLRRAEETLDDMCRCEFHRYLRFSPGEKHKWRVLELLDNEDHRQHTRLKQSFQGAVQAYKERKRHNNPYDKRHANQMNIHDIEGVVPREVTEGDSEPE